MTTLMIQIVPPTISSIQFLPPGTPRRSRSKTTKQPYLPEIYADRANAAETHALRPELYAERHSRTVQRQLARNGYAQHFRNGRHLASWLGLTPREHSSGNIRKLGGISKRGDRYVRMLLTHGARAVLLRAGQLQRADKPLNALQRWALALKARSNHNKATCALANKIVRIAWAT